MNHPKFTTAPQHNFSIAFLLEIINGISDPIFVKDRQHRWVLLNDAFCDFMGHSREELLGKSDCDFFPQQEADVFWDTDELVFTTGITNENEEDFTDAFGVTHVISTKKSLFEDETGKKFLVGTIRDITKNVTKYKQVEAELGQSQQLLLLVMDNIPQQIFWKDCNLVYMGCNRNFASVAGVGLPENIISKTDYDLPWKKEESDWYRECDRRVMESGKPELHIIETQQQADGLQSWSDTNKIPLCDAQGNVIGILGTCEDITERKHAEEALFQSEAKLQLAYAELETLVLVRTKQLAQINETLQAKIAEHQQTEAALIRSNALLQAQQEAALDAILIVDENFQILSYNNKFTDIWQIPLALVETGDEQQILPLAVEKTLNPEEFLAKVQYLYQHREETSRDEVALKDGRTLDRYSAPVRRRETACCQTSLSEDYYGRIWCFRDITESKQAEQVLRKSEARLRQQAKELEQALDQLQRTQIQLVQSEKMSSLGQLVAGIAHEINNPVNFIYGNLCHTDEYTQDLFSLLQLYQQYYPHPVREIQDYLDLIELDFLKSDLPQILTSMKVGAERIRLIVLSLRTFSRLDEAEMKKVDIHEGIDSTLMILQSRLNANGDRPAIEVIKKYSNLPLVECYAGQLNQVFINILTNAIDALEEGVGSGEWGVGSSEDEEDKEDKEASSLSPLSPLSPSSPSSPSSPPTPHSLLPTPSICIHTELVEPNRVTIRIANNGPGIPEEVKQRLFDPFFTTKPVGKGTGLGLSICYQIVTERHGGSLQCISEAGQGAEFVITIPLVQACEIPNF